MKKAIFVLLILVLALIAPVYAETLTYEYPGSNTVAGYYAYPYYFSIDGSAAFTPLMCLGFNNEITQGESWTATVTPLTTVPEFEAAWLFQDAKANSGNVADDQLAAWGLFASNAPTTAESDAQLSLALAGYSTINPGDFVLYVPDGGFNVPGVPQSFIGDKETPEVATLLMVGTGLFLLAFARRKWGLRRMTQAAAAVILTLGIVAGAQQPPPSKPAGVAVTPKSPYDSTKAQLAVEKEKNFQLQANAMTNDYQTQMKNFQQKYQDQEAALAAWMAKVRKDNGWDETYTYDRDSDTWTHTARSEHPKPEVKPATPEKK